MVDWEKLIEIHWEFFKIQPKIVHRSTINGSNRSRWPSNWWNWKVSNEHRWGISPRSIVEEHRWGAPVRNIIEENRWEASLRRTVEKHHWGDSSILTQCFSVTSVRSKSGNEPLSQNWYSIRPPLSPLIRSRPGRLLKLNKDKLTGGPARKWGSAGKNYYFEIKNYILMDQAWWVYQFGIINSFGEFIFLVSNKLLLIESCGQAETLPSFGQHHGAQANSGPWSEVWIQASADEKLDFVVKTFATANISPEKTEEMISWSYLHTAKWKATLMPVTRLTFHCFSISLRWYCFTLTILGSSIFKGFQILSANTHWPSNFSMWYFIIISGDGQHRLAEIFGQRF